MTNILKRLLKYQAVLSALIIIAASIASFAIVANGNSSSGQYKSVASVKDCKEKINDSRCYTEYFANKTYNQSPEAAFVELKTAYQQDEYIKSQCHQIVHIIGRTAIKKYKTLAATYPKGDSFCWSGFYHGATEQAIGDIGGDKIKSQANEVCADLGSAAKYSFSHFNCVHGLGHGFMSVDGYDVFEALKSCDLITDDWERKSCYGGVYMENVMVAARGDGTTNFLKKDDLLYPCNAVKAEHKEQCYLMQTSYALTENNYDFKETFELCATADEGFQNTCYQSIGRDASGSTVSDVARTKANCDNAQHVNAKMNCMIGASKDFVSYFHDDEQAKELCKAFGGELLKPCEETVSTYYKTF